jgi:hypothetical protein
MQWFCFNGYLIYDASYIQAIIPPRIHGHEVYTYFWVTYMLEVTYIHAMESTESIIIYICWKLHTCCQYFIPHRLHIKAKGIFISSIHQKCTGYTRDVQEHKTPYFIPNANTSSITGSIQHVLQHYNFNTKAHTSSTLPTSTHKTNTASHAFPVLANHFLHLVQILL